jgi:glycosyltransferase involved in cell wall biosynthesis
MNTLTGIIITLNEAEHIADCIKSLMPVCNEIIIVDSGSSDQTLEIAQNMGAKVHMQKYLGDGPQRNHAHIYTKNEWILNLDADERLHDNAVKTINSLNLETTSYDAFALRRRNHIGSRWIKVCGWYPDYCIRLYNKEKTRFSENKQHDKVTTKNYKKINMDIVHYSFHNIGELFSRHPNRSFSTRAAKILFRKNRKVNSFSPFLHGAWALFNSYFLKRGFLGGCDGLTVAISSAVNSYLKYAKLLEYQRDQRVREKEDFESVF